LGEPVIRTAVAQAMREMGRQFVLGRDIGEAMEQTDVFPPMITQVFSVGQESGKLEEMLDRLAEEYDHQVQSAAERATALLEPALIIGLAVVVLFIVLAVILPLLETVNAFA
ncbi:MAG: type II secretion system F family protein, partial [Planctomycetota bacterium]